MSKTVTHWEIHYMPAHAGYLQVDMLDDRDKDVQVDTSGAGSLEIRMPHPFERSQRVIKSIPWHRVNYVQRVEREVPDSA